MKYVFIIMILFSLILNADFTDFDTFIKDVNALEDSLLYDSAYALSMNAIEAFPDKEFDILKEMIYINNKTENYQKNIDIWKAGHDNGYFFLIIPAMDQYKPYAELPGFDAVVERDAELRAEALKSCELKYEIVLPDNYDAKKKYPAMFILHGGGSSIEKAKKSWAIPQAIRDKYIFVYFQSYICIDYNTYGWKKKDVDAAIHFSVLYPNLMLEQNIDTENIYLCGVSAGGTEALDLALRNVFPVRGLFLICPGIPEPVEQAQLNDMAQRGTKLFMLSGENDFYLQRQKEFTLLADSAGLQYKYEIIEGMGHEMPPSMEDTWPTAMEYISK